MRYRAEVMRFTLLKLICLITFAYLTGGCSNTDTIEAQNRWLERNYPDRAAQFDKLPNAQTFFKEDVLAGNIQFGMYVDEVLIASSTAPYGPKRYQGKFWCDNDPVNRCDNNCNRCDGIVLLKNRLIFFRGISQTPVVIDIYDNYDDNSEQSLFSKPLSLRYLIEN